MFLVDFIFFFQNNPIWDQFNNCILSINFIQVTGYSKVAKGLWKHTPVIKKLITPPRRHEMLKCDSYIRIPTLFICVLIYFVTFIYVSLISHPRILREETFFVSSVSSTTFRTYVLHTKWWVFALGIVLYMFQWMNHNTVWFPPRSTLGLFRWLSG